MDIHKSFADLLGVEHTGTGDELLHDGSGRRLPDVLGVLNIGAFFAGLLSPIVALTIGIVAANETLSWVQSVGVALVFASVATVVAGLRSTG